MLLRSLLMVSLALALSLGGGGWGGLGVGLRLCLAGGDEGRAEPQRLGWSIWAREGLLPLPADFSSRAPSGADGQ